MSPRAFISAGEASGDLHGANLARNLRALCPDLTMEGMGGKRMREAGVNVHVDIGGLAITGILEVVLRFPRVIGAFRRVVDLMRESRPDVAILIDAPEFNIRLARKAHQLGIPVIYYISPQLWAWRGHRIRELQRLVKKMLVILPFEADLYRSAGIDVEFVGHPLLDQTTTLPDREKFLSDLDLKPNRPVVSLLPGSRHNELEHMGPVLAETGALLRQRVPGVQLVVPLASTVPERRARRIFGQALPHALLVPDRTCEVLSVSDLAIACAGTVTLEAALLQTPLMVIYRTSALSYFIAQRLVKVDHVALVNLVARRRVVPEFLQDAANPEALAAAAAKIVQDRDEMARIRRDLGEVRHLLGEPGASRRAAEAVLKFVSRHPAADLPTVEPGTQSLSAPPALGV